MNQSESNFLDPRYFEEEPKRPWTKVTTKRVYASPWTQIDEDELVGPDGVPTTYRVVSMKPGVMIAAFTKAGEVFLVGQYRYAIDRFSWEVIGGAVDDGEEPLEAAKRELREEAGLFANQWTDLGIADVGTAYIKSKIWFFVAEDLTEGKASPEDSEDLMLRKIPFAEALHMVRTCKITHLPSVTLILKANDLMSNR